MYWTLKRMLAWGGISFVVVVIVIYAYIQARALIEGPKIVLESPTLQTSTSTLILVRGHIKNAKTTTLQGRPIFIDTKGYFNEKLLLSEGYNIIVLTAADVQGRTERKTFEVVYENPTSLVATTSAPESQDTIKADDVIQ